MLFHRVCYCQSVSVNKSLGRNCTSFFFVFVFKTFVFRYSLHLKSKEKGNSLSFQSVEKGNTVICQRLETLVFELFQ